MLISVRRRSLEHGLKEEMSIKNRAIARVFINRNDLQSPPADPEENNGPTSRSDNVPGSLTCSPWEGLYLEQNQAFAAPGDDASMSAGEDLEAFLSSLMYGE